MSPITLSDREALILQAVVHSYITTAEPVGSRAIVKRFGLDLSAATVRNVMADLEELGFVEQVHTSSGRVPTDRGYRYYVDYLMGVQELTLSERARIEREFTQQLDDADDVLKQTSHMLALISNQTGLVEAPEERDTEVRHIDLMPLSSSRVAVLVADSYGRVQTFVVSLRSPLCADDLPRLNRFLNEHLRGEAVSRLAIAMHQRIRHLLDDDRQLAEQALQVLDLVPANRPGVLFLEGATQLFEQPEFKDVAKAREVFGLLEEHDRVVDLLRSGLQRSETGSRIVIGSEIQNKGLADISVVAASYRVGDKPVGVLGILGPRRMPYWRLTAVVDYTASMLSRFLTMLAK
jgi:heat-inducible transcriptional repressor